jgi:hypothetical protein
VIATARQLALAAAIVLLLGVVLAIDVTRGAKASDRALVPGFHAESVTALVWPGRIAFAREEGAIVRDLRIARDSASSTGWVWLAPAGEAEPRAIDDVLAALRGARWHRSAAPEVAGSAGVSLVVERAGGALTIAIGEPFGEDQQWIVTGDRALLVDRWVVRALVPEPVALRVRAPLAHAAEAETIAVTPEVALQGSPRRIVRLGERPIQLLAAPDVVEPLEHALADLLVIALPSRPVASGEGARTISLDGVLVVTAGGGPCPDVPGSWAIVGARSGAGCVSETAWRRVVAAAERFALEPGALVERRPAPVPPDRVVLEGGVLDLARHPRVDDRDADPARIAELLAVLATPGEPVALPADRPLGELAIVAGDTTITLELYPGDTVARRGEPIGLRVGEGAHAILRRPARAYRDPTLWSEEPTTIRSITIDGVTFTRGAVLGEWMGPGADPARLDALAELLARLASRGDAPGAPRTPRTIEIVIEPPAGPVVTRSLVVGRGAAGCTATVSGAHVVVDPALCQ